MSKTLDQTITTLRTNVREELRKYVNEFDVDFWVNFVNNNEKTFAWCTPFRKISASRSSYTDPKGRFISFYYKHDDGISVLPYTKEEFFDQIVDLLFAKYF